MSKSVTLRDLFKAGSHFGHQTCLWNPKMAPYLYGDHNKIHIIDLEQTIKMLKDAMNCLGNIAHNKGKVLFVGTKRAAQEIIKEEAQRAKMPFVDHRWLGGMITNYKTVRQSIRRLKELEKMEIMGTFARMTKKEGLRLNRERIKLERSLGGIKDMGSLPDALFVIDVGYEKIAVQEAVKIGIPVIGVVDSNRSPDNIDYVIPGNDDSRAAIRLYAQAAADSIIEARASQVVDAGVGDDNDFIEVDEKTAVEMMNNTESAEADTVQQAAAAGGQE